MSGLLVVGAFEASASRLLRAIATVCSARTTKGASTCGHRPHRRPRLWCAPRLRRPAPSAHARSRRHRGGRLRWRVPSGWGGCSSCRGNPAAALARPRRCSPRRRGCRRRCRRRRPRRLAGTRCGAGVDRAARGDDRTAGQVGNLALRHALGSRISARPSHSRTG